MQLFQLGKEQLKYIGRLVSTMREHNGARMLEGVEIPLLAYEISGKAGEQPAGESRRFEGIDLRVAVKEDGAIDHQLVQEGIDDFVNSALFFAFNPLSKRGGENQDPNITLVARHDEPGKANIRFERLDLERFGVSAAAEALDKVERMMFAKWKRVPGEKALLQKTFGSEAERERTEHLILCMAQAAGFTQDEVNGAFYEPPDGRTLVVHKDFLAMLAKIEQTLEADFGSRRH